MRRPFVAFVGGGPGDPELITLKALRRIREADVVIHDRLVPAVLLDEVRPGTEVIDAGKAPGRHCMSQTEINRLLVDRARRRGHVARLKGGDPGVFARLSEEIETVRAAGIPFEIVPGISAALAAAARVGISLTERGCASTLVLATGADRHGTLPALDWDLLARSESTLVFYMAVATLPAIAASLTGLGRDVREPAIVVERAGCAEERVVVGSLGDIADRARRAGVEPPAVLLVGPTVATAVAPSGGVRLATAAAAV